MKKKLLVFHKALAPYRIDFLNGLHDAFDANVYFFRKNLRIQKFDTKLLESQLRFKPAFLTRGFGYKGRIIRFGYLGKIIRHKPDVIVGLEYSLMTFVTAWFTKTFLPGVKVYTTCDDSAEIAERCSGARRIARSLCLKYLDGIVLGNDPAEEWYNRHFPRMRTVVFPIIQDEERILSIINEGKQLTAEYMKKYKPEGKKVLLFVGRLMAVKNLRFLLQAFSQLMAANPDVVLILVGEGDQQEELKEYARELKIEGNVKFAGRYEHVALYAWYHVADYFILPSTFEPFGAVVNESLISGVPVLCSRLAGASSLINGKNGKLFNPYDTGELVSVLNEAFGSTGNAPQKVFGLRQSLMPYSFQERFVRLSTFLNFTG